MEQHSLVELPHPVIDTLVTECQVSRAYAAGSRRGWTHGLREAGAARGVHKLVRGGKAALGTGGRGGQTGWRGVC
jgi:hypothetical protein